MNRRVVVTGVGLISSAGIGTEQTWNVVRQGKSCVGRITQFDPERFDCQIAAEVQGFDPLNHIEKKEVKKMGRFIHFGVAAADFAIEMSGLKIDDSNAEDVGVYIGSGIGSFEVIEREHRTLLEKGPSRISPFFIPATIVNLASGQVSIKHGAKGPNSATATACTTSAHAIGDSYKLIQREAAKVMICGGAEGVITPMCVGGFAAMKALSTRNDDPEHASRPWDKDRDGFVLGEGAGILVLEDLEFAQARGANILAEIVGYGMSGDAYHFTSPSQDGMFRVMRNALKDARLQPDQIDYLNAHGTSTPAGDPVESAAIEQVFGEHALSKKLVVSSTKSMTGHLLGGAGGLEAGLSVLALRDQFAPPTANLEDPAEGCRLDYLPKVGRAMKIDHVLSNSFGFGGTNGSLIFKRWQQ
jgi:3-oxoacyl-[acyl-carrier-protein] synthase II